MTRIEIVDQLVDQFVDLVDNVSSALDTYGYFFIWLFQVLQMMVAVSIEDPLMKYGWIALSPLISLSLVALVSVTQKGYRTCRLNGAFLRKIAELESKVAALMEQVAAKDELTERSQKTIARYEEENDQLRDLYVDFEKQHRNLFPYQTSGHFLSQRAGDRAIYLARAEYAEGQLRLAAIYDEEQQAEIAGLSHRIKELETTHQVKLNEIEASHTASLKELDVSLGEKIVAVKAKHEAEVVARVDKEAKELAEKMVSNQVRWHIYQAERREQRIVRAWKAKVETLLAGRDSLGKQSETIALDSAVAAAAKAVACYRKARAMCTALGTDNDKLRHQVEELKDELAACEQIAYDLENGL
ncbi:hypothetical protein BT63DRAFT_233155 [Microthyrium microscopicum]|uniref:Uncharacterized protein n=1 Tax=Microthyrium microscopicum TaxID=703497 RepID=A0A6A6UD97_9PEZI|nr:hypothetical protein BT63DRAFT_233155 [Microthyrium microscopicum]